MFDAVALDLETLGTMPGNAILSIGMVEFNVMTGETGDEFFASFDADDMLTLGFTALDSTREWWADKARNQASKFLFQNRYTVGAGLRAVVEWLSARNLENGLWSRGYMDETMLSYAIHRVLGIEDPWHYRAANDARTLMMAIDRVFGLDIGIGNLTFEGVPHHALDDARHEAKLVAAAHQFLDTTFALVRG